MTDTTTDSGYTARFKMRSHEMQVAAYEQRTGKPYDHTGCEHDTPKPVDDEQGYARLVDDAIDEWAAVEHADGFFGDS